MTPLCIEILLHYNSRAVDYRDGDFSAPAVRAAIDWFCGEGNMLVALTSEEKARDDWRTYKLTERGQVYVNALQALPLPECRWQIPHLMDAVRALSESIPDYELRVPQ